MIRRFGITLAVALAVPPAGPLGESIAAFAKARVGEKVGDGDCTSLALAALREAGAKTTYDYEVTGDDAHYRWGEPIDDPKQIRPGDIVQFENAEFKHYSIKSRGGIRYRTWQSMTYDHHTAIVGSVARGNKVKLYEQNVGDKGASEETKRKVRVTPLDLDDQVRGKVTFYRPVLLKSP